MLPLRRRLLEGNRAGGLLCMQSLKRKPWLLDFY
jgi:hypothetical protein